MGKDTLNKKGHGSLNGQFLKMTLLPLVGMGLIMILFCSISYKTAMQGQVKKGLRTVGVSVLNAYDAMYDGDYNLVLDHNELALLYKGEYKLSGNEKLIDAIKEETEHDISLFFYNIRMLTTIKDDAGERYTGALANNRIVKEVLETGEERFYNNVTINGRAYLSYYIPVFGTDGTCIGMIAVARPADDVNHVVNTNLMKIIVIMIACLIVTALLITYFGKNISEVIHKIMRLLREMSYGNLNAELDHTVMKRNDELGDMGRFTTHVQAALRKLVERDELTGLYNRRSAESRLNQTYKKALEQGNLYSVAIGDIDFFKKVNDTYGHEAGDMVLRAVALILNDMMAGRGFAARWGGEEFLLVFEDMLEEDAAKYLNRILEKVRSLEVSYADQLLQVTMTFGVTQGAVMGSVNEELSSADAKLYHGKESGRNKVVVNN